MSPALRRAALSTLAATLALAASPAFAGDCWVSARAASANGVGNPATEAAEQLMRADPRLNAVSGVRFQANRGAGASIAPVRVGLHARNVWGPGCTLDQGRADYLTPASVTLSFNTPGDIAHALPAPPGEGGSPAFALLPQDAEIFERSGVIAYNGAGVRLYRAGGRRAIVPFRVRDHLAFWETELERISAEGGADFADAELAKLRARRASLSAAQLEAQVAQSAEAAGESLWGYAEASDEGAMPLYQIAPELLAPASDRGAVRVVVAEYSIADGDTVPEASLRAWLEGVDFSVFDPFFAK